jgi:hypothetical protein
MFVFKILTIVCYDVDNCMYVCMHVIILFIDHAPLLYNNTACIQCML